MNKLVLKGDKYTLFIRGELKKVLRKQVLSNSLFDYFLYWYEGKIQIKDNFGNKWESNFKTSLFKDYWTEEILDLSTCFVYYGQKTLFYNRFYEKSSFVGIKEGKFCLLLDLVIEDLLNQIKNQIKSVCPIQFGLQELVIKGFCYKNQLPLDSSEIY